MEIESKTIPCLQAEVQRLRVRKDFHPTDSLPETTAEALRTLAAFAKTAPGRLPERVQAALRIAAPEDCEHRQVSGAELCSDCGEPFILCAGCSEAGGADMPVYHIPPACATVQAPAIAQAPDVVQQGLNFLLTRIGSWTHSRWDQHLRQRLGDDHTESIIRWLAERNILPYIPEGSSGRLLQERTTSSVRR